MCNTKEVYQLLQLFTTHLFQQLNQIKNDEMEKIEDVSRSLCNAIIGDGFIYWYGTKEMRGIYAEITEGKEPFPKSKIYDEATTLTSLDRLIIVTRFSDDEEVLPLVEKAQQSGCEVIVLAAMKNSEDLLIQKADFYIDTKTQEPIVPLDDEKIVFPSLLNVLYTYYCLYVTTKEIIADFEGPLPTFE
jgi:uncharacterized phosphosugar-binding protein